MGSIGCKKLVVSNDFEKLYHADILSKRNSKELKPTELRAHQSGLARVKFQRFQIQISYSSQTDLSYK